MFAATATEDNGIGNGVTTEAVKAVHASRHFSCRIQPRNRATLMSSTSLSGVIATPPIV